MNRRKMITGAMAIPAALLAGFGFASIPRKPRWRFIGNAQFDLNKAFISKAGELTFYKGEWK